MILSQKNILYKTSSIETGQRMFEELKQEILNCRLCEEKFEFEPHPILMGNVNSKIMQISQAPSLNVHKTLKPLEYASEWKYYDTMAFRR